MSKTRLTFAIALLVLGARFKAGEVIGPLGKHLRLNHLEEGS